MFAESPLGNLKGESSVSFSINKRNVVIGIFSISILAISYFFFTNTKINSAKLEAEKSKIQRREIQKLRFMPQTPQIAKRFIDAADAQGKVSKNSADLLKSLMWDNTFNTFFNYTLDFFGRKEDGFAAARFVALTLVFMDTPESRELMNWTKKDIEKNSQTLFKKLQDKKSEIDVNPYFHNRMLNLVHSLAVPREEKIQFLSESVSTPIQFVENGQLSDGSRSLEIALVLLKANTSTSEEAAPAVIHSLAKNNSPQQREALRERVLAFYPELARLF